MLDEGRRPREEIFFEKEVGRRRVYRYDSRIESRSFQDGKTEHRRHPVGGILGEPLPFCIRRCVGLYDPYAMRRNAPGAISCSYADCE